MECHEALYTPYNNINHDYKEAWERAVENITQNLD
jgi:hypothetical protein